MISPTDCEQVGRKKENHRLLHVRIQSKLEGKSVYAEQSKGSAPRTLLYNIE